MILSVFIEALGIAVLFWGQAGGERLRRARATQHRINLALTATLSIGAALVIGGLALIIVAQEYSGNPSGTQSPAEIVGWLVSQLVFLSIGLIFVTRRLRTVRRLNGLGRDHPLCRRSTVELDASPEVALGWAKSTARSAHAQNIEIDPEALTLWAETSATLLEGGRMIDVQVELTAAGGSKVAIYSWPSNMVKRDYGTGQYFVDKFADRLREISIHPPDPHALTPIKKWG